MRRINSLLPTISMTHPLDLEAYWRVQCSLAELIFHEVFTTANTH
jgi:hypothetical protein